MNRQEAMLVAYTANKSIILNDYPKTRLMDLVFLTAHQSFKNN